jgi:hypothetical protein
VIPIPRVVKAAVPSISVAMRPGSVDARTCTPYATAPRARVTTVIANMIRTVDPIRAAM